MEANEMDVQSVQEFIAEHFNEEVAKNFESKLKLYTGLIGSDFDSGVSFLFSRLK